MKCKWPLEPECRTGSTVHNSVKRGLQSKYCRLTRKSWQKALSPPSGPIRRQGSISPRRPSRRLGSKRLALIQPQHWKSKSEIKIRDLCKTPTPSCCIMQILKTFESACRNSGLSRFLFGCQGKPLLSALQSFHSSWSKVQRYQFGFKSNQKVPEESPQLKSKSTQLQVP